MASVAKDLGHRATWVATTGCSSSEEDLLEEFSKEDATDKSEARAFFREMVSPSAYLGVTDLDFQLTSKGTEKSRHDQKSRARHFRRRA